MKQITIKIRDIKISNSRSFVLFGGINVLESYEISEIICEHFINITKKLKIPYVFKASFDKANRTHYKSYRGVGLKNGMKIFKKLKDKFNVLIMTDVHEREQVKIVKNFVDIIQIPAFLARQTDLIEEIAKSGMPINVKKPQFLSHEQVKYIIEKIRNFGNKKIILCERGNVFGYENLVVDMLGFNIIKVVSNGLPVIFDASHSLQKRNSKNKKSCSGRNWQIFNLSQSAICSRIAGLFVESYFNPEDAKCDGFSSLPIKELENFLQQIKKVDTLIKSFPEKRIGKVEF
ncbi:3-deoxy-8-phosphooctulonate synthase [bacterium endosymbiont of Pedicinus badii]|uniref:3-deoxy-8-phosphooctulonate synthase n=1 Tax=bacterium endosymbiont of Pedicinus badii TaxID=1719126 RepID=UPI0009BA68C3|nr:3-deoxy-8-phosphooctulonate synthase [bacterium endosymbiont of Pedicinus badii]OQM34383.1 2-dehydro-3-deoxyphosphooctonate aldolase [bacterium endosymbiont of Pedicinus badii]